MLTLTPGVQPEKGGRQGSLAREQGSPSCPSTFPSDELGFGDQRQRQPLRLRRHWRASAGQQPNGATPGSVPPATGAALAEMVRASRGGGAKSPGPPRANSSYGHGKCGPDHREKTPAEETCLLGRLASHVDHELDWLIRPRADHAVHRCVEFTPANRSTDTVQGKDNAALRALNADFDEALEERSLVEIEDPRQGLG